MTKVRFTDKRVIASFLEISAGFFATLSAVLIFVDIPERWRAWSGVITLVSSVVAYICVWIRANKLTEVRLRVEGSEVHIKVGDIFNEPGFKAIAFNEFFDTLVDDKVIARSSLNGILIEQHLDITPEELDRHIESYEFDDDEVLSRNVPRRVGKKIRYEPGTICVYNDFLLTAFAKFDERDRAVLEMPEYLEFLINFWDRVNRVYAQKSVSTTIFGSGITRIKGHKNISDEDLLKIMLWTFRISEMRFKYPAKLTIVVHAAKIDQINLFELKSTWDGG